MRLQRVIICVDCSFSSLLGSFADGLLTVMQSKCVLFIYLAVLREIKFNSALFKPRLSSLFAKYRKVIFYSKSVWGTCHFKLTH